MAQEVPNLVAEQPPSLGLRRRKNNDPQQLSHPSGAAEKTSGQAAANDDSDDSSNPKSNVDSLIGGAMRPSGQGAEAHHWAISTIDAHFRYFAIGVFCTYALFVATVYLVVPKENIVRLEGHERNSAM